MDVTCIKGVGPKKAKLLNKLNIFTVRDLLYYFPRGYEDRSELKRIHEVSDGEAAYLELKIVSTPRFYYIRKGQTLLRVQSEDASGECEILWFNNRYIFNTLEVGKTYKFYGKISEKKKKMLVNPIFETLESDKIGAIVPLYTVTKGLTENEMRKFLRSAWELAGEDIDEAFPLWVREKYGLEETASSIRTLHFPKDMESLRRARSTLKFRELAVLRLALTTMRSHNAMEKGIAFHLDRRMEKAIEGLPFTLTSSQRVVYDQVAQDLSEDGQTNRLIQGDVGSGKTVIAILAMILSSYSGYQSAFMAPTEILAHQHFENHKGFLESLGISSCLLTSGTTKKEREAILRSLAEGTVDTVFGTHALIQSDVEFCNLGLVITDEQHRFGVHQRTMLTKKGQVPNTLVMTATPIPRTLALILYGDLDISTIDELPPNRQAIETYVMTMAKEERVASFAIQQLEQGNQCYIVCPLVEDSETLSLESIESLYERLRKTYYKNYNLEVIHGKLSSQAKKEIMDRFKNNETQILLATTVIEVGVDVPNANIMVIYNAERFGLAQLHQLRGRVGRGEDVSYCILMVGKNTPTSYERMKAIKGTRDGFVIAQKDLELRGSGDIYGVRQHGIPQFKIANLYDDLDILERVDELCRHLWDQNLFLGNKDFIFLKKEVEDAVKSFQNVILN